MNDDACPTIRPGNEAIAEQATAMIEVVLSRGGQQRGICKLSMWYSFSASTEASAPAVLSFSWSRVEAILENRNFSNVALSVDGLVELL